MKKFIPILTLVLIVIVSGCTNNTPTVSSTEGVIINEFSADDTVLDSGDTTTVYLEVENVGGVEATDVKAYLFGVDDWNVQPSAMQSLGNLRAPDIRTNVPGEIKMSVWTLTAPAIPQGVKQSFPITVRVLYGYKTTASGQMQLYSEYEWKRLAAKGQISSSNIIPVENSNGPIHVSIQGPDKYEVRGNDEIPIVVTFTNEGSGDPVKQDWDDGKLDGQISILGPAEIECEGQSGKNIALTDLELRRGKPRRMSCVLKVTDIGDNPISTVTINFDFDYKYCVSRLVTISVVGQR